MWIFEFNKIFVSIVFCGYGRRVVYVDIEEWRKFEAQVQEDCWVLKLKEFFDCMEENLLKWGNLFKKGDSV